MRAMHAVLEVMSDGKWRACPTLWSLTRGPAVPEYSALKWWLVYMRRCGLIVRADNPLHDRSLGPGEGVGVPASRFVYQISDRGRARLRLYREGRIRIPAYGWILPSTAAAIKELSRQRTKTAKPGGKENYVPACNRARVAALLEADRAKRKPAAD